MGAADREAAAKLCVGVGGLAEIFHVSEVTIAEWVKLGMPKHSHGKYRIMDCVQWRRSRDLETARGGDGDLTEERRRLIVEQRRGHELENAERAGDLLSADEVTTDMLAYAAIVASQLDALPQRLAPRLVGLSDPDVMRRTLRDECRVIRSAASEAFAAYGVRLADGEDHGSAPKPRRRAVGRRTSGAADRLAGAGAVED